jgi:hypothetical protein
VDPVHRSVDIFYRFSNREIIPEILEIAGALNFFKKTPKLFQNFILVPVILHLGPQLTFYNYDWVTALINLIYFNYRF